MTKKARIYNGIETVYSINGVKKTEQLHAKKKNETGPPSYTIYKNKLIME